jgi:AcrR family transcriptional regulator
MTAAAPRPPQHRRSQAERRATTRAALLDAAIAALVELGFARTTTTEVCRRAGLSQGALFAHFSSKAELVAAAAERLFAALIADYRVRFGAIPAGADRVAAAVDTLWEVFSQPRIHAAFALYEAARTDGELAATLAPVVARHGANLRSEARAVLPEAAGLPRFDSLVDLAVNAMQGLALGGASADDARSVSLRSLLTTLLREALAIPTRGR